MLVYSLKNTFVLKDSLILKQMGYEVLLIQSAPHSDLVRFFWNRISVDRWNDAQTFKCKDMDYQKVLEKEIIPFFK